VVSTDEPPSLPLEMGQSVNQNCYSKKSWILHQIQRRWRWKMEFRILHATLSLVVTTQLAGDIDIRMNAVWHVFPCMQFDIPIDAVWHVFPCMQFDIPVDAVWHYSMQFKVSFFLHRHHRVPLEMILSCIRILTATSLPTFTFLANVIKLFMISKRIGYL